MWNCFDFDIPIGPVLPGAVHAMADEFCALAVAMIIKHPVIMSDDNVIARMAIFRVKPKCSKIASRVIFLDKGVGEDMASATGKEYPVRQVPAHHRIAFAIVQCSWLIHSVQS
ncbi:hypothetical protein [Thalassospira alkalitolerans]|uniref:hypothetical protein n=1 Tax=Thalassospira alkalitolerans TaxID=1293890 RepID=UPI003AA90ADE